jgi:hypothetical protein
VASILAAAHETSEVMMVIHALIENKDDVEWFAVNPTLRSAPLAPPIDEVLFGTG